MSAFKTSLPMRSYLAGSTNRQVFRTLHLRFVSPRPVPSRDVPHNILAADEDPCDRIGSTCELPCELTPLWARRGSRRSWDLYLILAAPGCSNGFQSSPDQRKHPPR